jgi:hypothetical protein
MPDLYLPPAADPPDPDFRETEAGGHALVLEHAPGHALLIEYGDCEFYFTCQCGRSMPSLPLRPDRSWLPVLTQWFLHCGPAQLIRAHCQCGRELGRIEPPYNRSERWMDPLASAWEKHTMTELKP